MMGRVSAFQQECERSLIDQRPRDGIDQVSEQTNWESGYRQTRRVANAWSWRAIHAYVHSHDARAGHDRENGYQRARLL